MRALKLALRLALSLAVSGLLMWLSLRNADLRAVGRATASATPWRMLAYACVLLAIHLIRTVRWGILLEPLGHVGFKRLNSASAVGFMLLVLLPLRLEAFISALHLGSGWKALAFFALTAAYWSLNGLGLAVLAPAFGFHLAPLMVATILAVQVVGVMVPAGPGMIGTMQFFTQAGLSLFVPDAFTRGSPVAAHAAGYANALWMLNFGVQVGLGLLFMLLGHVSLRGLLQR